MYLLWLVGTAVAHRFLSAMWPSFAVDMFTLSLSVSYQSKKSLSDSLGQDLYLLDQKPKGLEVKGHPS